MKYVITDLDGCLSDDRWRHHLLPNVIEGDARQDAWDAYHEQCGKDALVELTANEILQLRIACPEPVMLLFVTARPERFRDITRTWIENRLSSFWLYVYWFSLLMRPNGNMEKAPTLKFNLVSDYFQRAKCTFGDVIAAFDDRQDVLDAYPISPERRRLVTLPSIGSGKFSFSDPLPPCPCCGGKAVEEAGRLNGSPSEIWCTNCGLSTGWSANARGVWSRRPTK